MFLYTFYRKHLLTLRIIALFLMGLFVAIGIALHHLDLESLRGNIVSALRDASNMPIEIDGKISWRFSLRPEIELNNVRIPNADWAKNKNLFSAKKIDVRLDLLSMFKSHPVIRHISVYDAKINVEKNDKNEISVVFNKTQTPEKSPDTEKNVIKRYPVEQLPFGGMDIEKLSVNLYGDKYELSSLGISNYMRHSNREFSGWVKPYDTNFPFVIQFSEYNNERKIYPVKIAFATGGEPLIANIALEGTSKMPIDFVITGETPNIKELGRWFNIDTMDVPKMKMNVAFNIDRKKISFRKSSIESRGSSINFSGMYDWSKSIPVVRLNVSSDMINLYKSFPEWFGVGEEWVHPDRELNAFKDMPLFGEYLYNLDAEINVKMKHFIVYRHLDLSDMDVKLTIKNHTVRADALVGIADGKVHALLNSDIYKNGMYDATLAAVGHNVYVGGIIDQVDVKDILSGLPMNINLYVKAYGKDMSEIMQTITGPVLVYSTDRGFAHADLVEYMYGGDFLTTLRNGVEDMFTGNKRDMIQIDNAIVNVILRNGLIETENGVSVESHVINMRLAGSLDLGKETMHLSLATVPVKGLKLSISGNLVNTLQIAGNLSEPDFNISGAAVAGKVGSAVGIGLLLSPLTGGLSIAGGLIAGMLAGDLLEGWLADEHPYETAKKSGAPLKRSDPDWLRQPVEKLSNSLFETKGK